MASLLESFSQTLLSPDSIDQLRRVAGIDAAQTKRGLDVIGPLVVSSLARKSETTSGRDEITRMLPDGSGSLLDWIPGLGKAQSPLAAAGLLSGVLGPGVSSIGKALSSRLGFDVMPLVTAATPALLGFIAKTAKEKKLNSEDIAKTLQQERTAMAASATPEVQAVLNEVTKIGDKAEALKRLFTDDEWKAIRLSPMAATFYVVSSSPSGRVGLAKEVIAAGQSMKALVTNALPTSLVDVAFGSFDGKLAMDDALDERAPRNTALHMIRQAAQAIKAKSPVDTESYGETIVALAREVAAASKEGGFLGIGGTRVSVEEEHAIADITAAVA